MVPLPLSSETVRPNLTGAVPVPLSSSSALCPSFAGVDIDPPSRSLWPFDQMLVSLGRVSVPPPLYRISAGYKEHDPLSYGLPSSKTDDGVKIERVWREGSRAVPRAEAGNEY